MFYFCVNIFFQKKILNRKKTVTSGRKCFISLNMLVFILKHFTDEIFITKLLPTIEAKCISFIKTSSLCVSFRVSESACHSKCMPVKCDRIWIKKHGEQCCAHSTACFYSDEFRRTNAQQRALHTHDQYALHDIMTWARRYLIPVYVCVY